MTTWSHVPRPVTAMSEAPSCDPLMTIGFGFTATSRISPGTLAAAPLGVVVGPSGGAALPSWIADIMNAAASRPYTRVAYGMAIRPLISRSWPCTTYHRPWRSYSTHRGAAAGQAHRLRLRPQGRLAIVFSIRP